MRTPDINPIELKVFLNHIYELKKGVRQMVLYTTNRKLCSISSCRALSSSMCLRSSASRSLLRGGGSVSLPPI